MKYKNKILLILFTLLFFLLYILLKTKEYESFQNNNTCVVALCSNEAYYTKALETIKEIRTIGAYDGDIVFFYDTDFTNSELLDALKKTYNVTLKQFPKIDTSSVIDFLNKNKN